MPRETILSLPKSKTSTGIYAVRDENVEHHAPSKTKANKQVADQQFVAMTELSMYQQLNEKLQVKLQDVEAQKEEAIAAETRALNAAGALRRDLDESQKAAERVERELREQLEAERARVDRQEGYVQEQQRKIVQLTQALETERSEVQRAAAHAQRAGQAADAAHEMLVAEREESQQREATAVENALFEARAARDAAEAARDDLAQRVEEMEEDVEAEREWRESAQKQAARLAKQADAAAAAADREEATAQNLRRALETLRQENEAAEATRKEEAERRRTGAARRVRDRQTSEHREKEALRAKVQSLEHDLEKANQRLDDMPRMQSEIRRLKALNRKHAQQQQQRPQPAEGRSSPISPTRALGRTTQSTTAIGSRASNKAPAGHGERGVVKYSAPTSKSSPRPDQGDDGDSDFDDEEKDSDEVPLFMRD